MPLTFGYPSPKPAALTASQPVVSTPAASELHLGMVGGVGAINVPTMNTQTNGAYSAGDFVGSTLTLTAAARVTGGSGYIEAVKIFNKSVASGSFDVWFFNATITNPTDNAAKSILANDLIKLIGVAHCNDVTNLGNMSLHGAWNLGMPYKLVSTIIYALIVCNFALTTTSTTDITMAVDLRQD